MNSFDDATIRLKQVLGVTKDKEVAEYLDLSPVAWAGRKRRGLFPETELYALLAKRPDLQIDVHYVLTGQRVGGAAGDQLQRMHKLSAGLTPDLQRLAAEASAKHAATPRPAAPDRDQDFLARVGAVLPWCDDDLRDLMLRMAQYGARRP